MKTLAVIASIFLSGSSVAFSSSEADTITMYSEIVATPNDVFAAIGRLDTGSQVDTFTEESVDIGSIVNLGQKVWDIIKANQPVANIHYNFANALPLGVASSAALTGFSDVESSSTHMWGTNGFGVRVYDITLTAVHQYGGQYNDKGHFLETVAIIPSNVEVQWGYTLNYSVDHVTTVNGGTAEDPIAKIALQATLKVETIFKKTETNTVYQFRGDSANVATAGF